MHGVRLAPANPPRNQLFGMVSQRNAHLMDALHILKTHYASDAINHLQNVKKEGYCRHLSVTAPSLLCHRLLFNSLIVIFTPPLASRCISCLEKKRLSVTYIKHSVPYFIARSYSRESAHLKRGKYIKCDLT